MTEHPSRPTEDRDDDTAREHDEPAETEQVAYQRHGQQEFEEAVDEAMHAKHAFDEAVDEAEHDAEHRSAQPPEGADGPPSASSP